ncbi:MAG: DnaJ C-terminal domain-containing protein [Nocardioides sp.]|uniref:DnaJ C-terminal domain-containing protein n=1 Tax=Nocardioides sp. TaxID=35761 RepID=UPI0039E669BD
MAENDGIRSDWMNKDFYAELGVKKDATAEEIKKSYRKLARANHPDSHPDDTEKHEKFKRVAEAYDVVGDPEKRKKYDEVRSLAASGGFGGSAGGRSYNFEDLFGNGGNGGSGGSGGNAGGGIGDMFGDLFGGGFGRRTQQPRSRPVRGADVESNATIGFTEALEGVTVSLRLSSDAACEDCHGTGGKPGTKPKVCPVCEGAGYVVNSVGGGFSMNETCPRCGGRQLVYDEACPTCHGSGRGTSTRTIQARIPAGVKDGQRIRLKGKGAAGENGGPAGDLFVTIHVSAHPLFGRKDDSLTLDVPVSFDELALGAEIRIPTLNGPAVTLRVPAGTPNGRIFRVRGKGFTRSDGTHGDLLATVEVQVPAVLDEGSRVALEAYRDAADHSRLRSNLFNEAAV